GALAAQGDVAAARLAFEEVRAAPKDAILSLCRGQLDLALGREAAARGDAEGAADHQARATRRRDEVAPPGRTLRSGEARTAWRLLERALQGRPGPPPTEAPERSAALQIDPDGRWFSPPEGERVSLARHRALWQILIGLAKQRQEAPDQA